MSQDAKRKVVGKCRNMPGQNDVMENLFVDLGSQVSYD